MGSQLGLPGPSNQSDDLEQNVFPCFIPDQDCIPKIIKWVDSAQETIILQAYSFSSKQIADALIRAKERGIYIKVLIDKDARAKRGNLIDTLRRKGIEIEVDQQDGKAHNKVMIIDDEYVITGSYNWTDIVNDHNSDVIIFIRDACVNRKYRANYNHNLQINRMKLLPQRYMVSLFDPSYDCRGCGVSFYNFHSKATTSQDDGFTIVETKNKKKKEKSEHFVEVNVCFPRFNNQDCIKLILNYINNAKKSIFIQSCSFTHEDISDALINTHKRNITVNLLIDKKAFNDKKEKIRSLIISGIEVKWDTTCHSGIAHTKTIIIDNDVVLTGSFNLTYSAQNVNQENLLHMRNIYVNKTFKDHFWSKWNEAEQIYDSKSRVS